ncbi:hypothetical protein SSP35_05_02250 [Streptomyces sp. NBRC 110611]|nr:hypothetical protein SSP35_05_02250 [Streptomyces sp. NBRC 110611]
MHYDHARLLAAMNAAGDTDGARAARRLDVHPATAWRLRVGRSQPSTRTLAAIERAYGLTASDLFRSAA